MECKTEQDGVTEKSSHIPEYRIHDFLNYVKRLELVVSEFTSQVHFLRKTVADVHTRLDKVEGKEVKESRKRYAEVTVIDGDTYKSLSTLIVIPSRKLMHTAAVAAFDAMAQPMNIVTGKLFIQGDEVGEARNKAVRQLLSENGKRFEYILFMDDDVLPPADAWLNLMKWTAEYKIIAGLYFTKTEPGIPLMYQKGKEEGVECWMPLYPNKHWTPGAAVEVDGCGMGFTWIHRSVFENVSEPWFKTRQEVVEGVGILRGTEDLYFCEKVINEYPEAGRVLVDTSVRCSHLDIKTDKLY